MNEIKTMKLGELRSAPYNPRKISKEALAGLTASIKRFGLVQPIILNKRSGFVVGGHQRIKALQKLGHTETQVLIVDLPDSEEKVMNVTLNNSEIAGEFTDDLDQLLKDIQSQMGEEDFEELNLHKLMDEMEKVEQDEIPSPPDKAITKRGQIWILGNHRLMCGDSSSKADLDRLLSGEKIHLVNTDPPYNVRVEPRSNNAIASGNSSFSKTHHQSLDLSLHPNKSKPPTKKMRAKDRPLINDFMKPAAFDTKLSEWFGQISRVLIPGRAFYIWGGYANCSNYPKALVDAELYFAQTIIWIKQHPVLTRKDFMGNHEWCFYGWREDQKNLVLVKGGFTRDHKYAFYGWREGAAHYFNPEIFNASDVWEVKKVSPQMMVHLTEKPVELAARAMSYSSVEGENILDLFGGSGSTLMAAEQLNRRAFLMELDPPYCDVIVERWEKFTGKKAKLLK